MTPDKGSLSRSQIIPRDDPLNIVHTDWSLQRGFQGESLLY